MQPIATHRPDPAKQRSPRRDPAQAGGPAAVSLRLVAERSPERQRLEACITRQFDDHYSACLHEFLPYLLGIDVAGELNAVVGLQPASAGDLFLERYLDVPVEQAISRVFRRPVDRTEIVEIGNLSAAVAGATYALFTVLARALHLAGFRWVVCTATLQVEAMLANMQFPSRPICRADPSRLGEEASNWGDYYAGRPQVITGDVEIAQRLLQTNQTLIDLTRQLAGPIGEIAGSLRQHVG